MVSTVRRYEVTDDEWARIKPYIPEAEDGSRGRPVEDARKMLNGICWIMRSGAAWRDLPEKYGPWQTVYKIFVQWQKAGIFEKILKDLGLDEDMQDISIDSTCIKAHKASAGAKKEQS